MVERKSNTDKPVKLKPGDEGYKHILMGSKRLQDKGLVHSMRYVTVQTVGKAHKKVCDVCVQVPTERRLLVKTGSGRAQQSRVLCVKCAGRFLDQAAQEAWRAFCRLHGDDVPVRFVDGELDVDRELFPWEPRDDD